MRVVDRMRYFCRNNSPGLLFAPCGLRCSPPRHIHVSAAETRERVATYPLLNLPDGHT